MFGTDNLYFVPEDARLAFIDLHAAERWELDVMGLKALAAEGLRATMKTKLSAALKEHWDVKRHLSVEEREELQRQTQAFFDVMEWTDEGAAYEAAFPLEAMMAPLEMTLWLRLSDAPMESFAAEDYLADDGAGTSGGGAAAGHQFTPAYGALEIRALEQWELKMPGEPGEMPFFLRWADGRQAVTRGPIDPLAPLPIVEEFIGPEGVSARGNVANYTLRGELADTNTGAVPLYQREGRLFVTLYFNIAQQLEFDVLFNRLPARPEAVNERLAANGFTPANHGPGWAIYSRNGDKDIIHFYYDIEGKEAIALMRTHPFLWIAQADGGAAPGERSKLMIEMGGLFPETPGKKA